MAQDIYGRTINFGGAFAADAARLDFPAAGLNSDLAFQANAAEGAGGAGLLVQSLQGGYQIAINKLYEVGTPKIYYVAGRTQGQLAMSQILGPVALSDKFYATYGDVCKMTASGNEIILGLRNDLCNTGAGQSGRGQERKMKMLFCVLQSVGFSVQATDMLVNQQVSMMIGLLSYDTA